MKKTHFIDGRPATRKQVVMALAAHGLPEDMAAYFILDKLKKAAGAVVGAVSKGREKIDKGLEKTVGRIGGEDACEWITAKGPKGTTHLCIDHEGKIEKGPEGLKGKSAGEHLGEDHVGAKEAQQRAIDKKKGKDDQKAKDAETGADKYKAHVKRLKDAALIIGALRNPAAAALAKVAGKYCAGKIGVVKRISEKLEQGIRDRYGEPAGSAIIAAGVVSSVVAGPLVPPPVGTVLSYTPGAALVYAIPFVAAAEAVKQTAGVGKLLGAGAVKAVSGLKKLGSTLRGLGGGGGRASPSPAMAAMSEDEDGSEFYDESAATFGGVDVATIKREGDKYMKQLRKLAGKHLAKDAESLKEFTDAMKKLPKGKKKNNKDEAKFRLDGRPASREEVVASLAAVGLPESFAVHFSWDAKEHPRGEGGRFTVTRAELAQKVSDKLGISQAQAKEAVGHVLDGITDAMEAGHRVELRHFGTFEKKKRKAKKARNPRTGEEMTVPAQSRVSFRPGKSMKKAAKKK